MRSARAPLACGIAVLLVTGCTADPEPSESQAGQEQPAPPPTEFQGEAPPGLEGEALRHLHGEDADVHPMLDDAQGVRISAVGGAFLISSDGEDDHLLHDAATGEALWEGEAGFRGFAADTDGAPVLLMSDADDEPFVLGPDGERVWSAEDTGGTYLDGVVVQRPEDWSVEEPGGAFTVSDTDGDELWSYDFEPAEDEDAEGGEGEEDEETDGETGEGSEDEDGEDTEEETGSSLGVPVAAWDGAVLLSDGDSALHAHSLEGDEAGEELWSVTGADEELAEDVAGAVPQIIGRYGLPAGEEGGDEDGDGAEGDNGDDGDGADDNGDGEADNGEDGLPEDGLLLLRWARTEAPSTLTAHDLDTGEPLWTLQEPGANPAAEPFDTGGATGSLYDSGTATLLLQQAGGQASYVAVDLAEGEERWGLEEDTATVSPAFAFDGLVYGDQRGEDEGGSQLVLDAVTMDVVDDDSSARVEAVTDTGHAILVQDRQRFVYGPPPAEDGDTDGDGEGDGEDNGDTDDGGDGATEDPDDE